MTAKHWPEYLMEAAGLGLFMISAGAFATLLEHPNSTVHHALPSEGLRRFLMGLAMGATAVAIIYSPWGKRSGAHINPATTLTFWRLGKVSSSDAAFYAIAHFAGGLAGVLVIAALLGDWFLEPPVAAVTTRPGTHGAVAALLAEFGMTFLLMLMVLTLSNTRRFAHFTGLVVGLLVATYIIVEAPLSGMSMNPARTFASAVARGQWAGIWIYFVAPPLGMLAAGAVFVSRRDVRCAKLDHDDRYRCIFCEYQSERQTFDARIGSQRNNLR